MAEARPWLSRRLLERAFLLAAGAGAVWAGWGLWHDRSFPGRFTQVRIGMDRASAVAILGAPDWEGACARRLVYLPRAECSSELGYSSAFAPIRPVYHVVQLDRRGRVIDSEPVITR